MRKGTQATLLYGGFSLGLLIALPLGLYSLGLRPPLLAWLAGASLAAFVVYWGDKEIASTGNLRVPEWVLLALALLGGSPGALLSMLVFHHKTNKASFQVKFWAVVVLQILAISAWRAFVR